MIDKKSDYKFICIMKIKHKKLGNSHQFIQYRTEPKNFNVSLIANRPKIINNNPLYSTDSLAKYFNLPTSDLDLTVGRSCNNFDHKKVDQNKVYYMTQRAQKNKITNDKLIDTFNTIQQKMRIYQQSGSQNIKKKLQIFERYNNKTQQHFQKIKNSTNYDDYPRLEIDMDVNPINRYTQIPKKYTNKKHISLRAKTLQLKKQLHSENIKKYLELEHTWVRYGYHLQVEDPEEVMRRSLEKQNKNLRRKCKTLDNKASSLQIKKNMINQNLYKDSKQYMEKRIKTSEF